MANAEIYNTRQSPNTSGWVSFAGILMIIAGCFHAIAGLVALFKSDLYVAAENHLFVMDYSQWGWAHILIGIILILSAVSLFSGRLWGRMVAIALASVSAIANFAFIWAYPVWSILIIAMDIFIIYAVVTMGNAEEE